MKELSSFDVFNLVKESQFLIGGKIDNIYQTDDKSIYLQLYIKDKPKQLLRIVSGKCFYLTRTRPDFPENLHRFCSYLKKYLMNSRIKAIEQIGYERIIKITLETKDDKLELFAEVFGKGNILLTKDNKILSAAEDQIWADRVLKPGENYVYPKKADSKELFEKYMQKGSDITMEVLEEELSKEVIRTKSSNSVKQKEINKINTILEKQKEQLEKITREAETNRKKGELIYERYQEIKDIVDKVKNLKSESQIREALKNNKHFKNIKDGKLILELQ